MKETPMINCWKCNGTGRYGGVDGTLYECEHPKDTREYTDKGYLIMGTDKYDEALNKMFDVAMCYTRGISGEEIRTHKETLSMRCRPR